MKQFKDLEAEYKADEKVKEQLHDEFGSDIVNYEIEYDEFFNGDYIKQVIEQSSSGNGAIAGSGPVDYNEGKVLYSYIRKHKPKLILECGTASGCSSVIMARALEMNNLRANISKETAGVIHTVDISTDNYEAGIDLFRMYVDNGLIETKFGVDAIQYINDNKNIKYDMTFIDADHKRDFCYNIAKALKTNYPDIPHFYHEWLLTNIAPKDDLKYVSYTQHIGSTFEREAFESVFSSSRFVRTGFYGSCGLGLIKPKPIKIFYRLSSRNAFTSKYKLPYNKHACLVNLIKEFGTGSLIIQADNCSDDVIYQLEALKVNYYITNCSSSSESFITLLNKIKELNDDELVYIVEDDYLHKPGAKKILMEGLSTGADYVSLYDHPDKYIDATNGGNPYIEGGGEVTKVLLTKSCHWKYTNSTCLTFATTAKSIKDDFEIWKWAVFDNPSLGSFQAFITLRDKSGRVLISSIPGYATHIEVAWLTPLTDWNKL